MNYYSFQQYQLMLLMNKSQDHPIAFDFELNVIIYFSL
jgi:hypothetical protein